MGAYLFLGISPAQKMRETSLIYPLIELLMLYKRVYNRMGRFDIYPFVFWKRDRRHPRVYLFWEISLAQKMREVSLSYPLVELLKLYKRVLGRISDSFESLVLFSKIDRRPSPQKWRLSFLGQISHKKNVGEQMHIPTCRAFKALQVGIQKDGWFIWISHPFLKKR